MNFLNHVSTVTSSVDVSKAVFGNGDDKLETDSGVHKEGPFAQTCDQVSSHPLMGFEFATLEIPINELLPSKKLPDGMTATKKFRQIVSSIKEIGLIEPLSVIVSSNGGDEHTYLVLDGHLRVLALKELGQKQAPCLIAKDFETYTYNHRINRLSTVQEHYMLRRAIEKGVSKERLARAFDVNLSTIQKRVGLLKGINPKAVDLLKDQQFSPEVTRHLRKMKPERQVESVELMKAAGSVTGPHADALLKATPPKLRNDVTIAAEDTNTVSDPIGQISKLEKEMDQVKASYQEAEETYGSELLNLVVAKNYAKKLLANHQLRNYLKEHHLEIAEQLEFVLSKDESEKVYESESDNKAG